MTNLLEEGALLRQDDEWLLIKGPFRASKSYNSAEISVYCPAFYSTEAELFLCGEKIFRLSASEMHSLLKKVLNQSTGRPLQKAPWQEPRQDDFATSLRRIQERIARQEIRKAVPVVFARSAQTVSAIDRAQMLWHLLQAPATLHVYGFWQKGEGVLGATPEILFDYRQGLLKTMALAGTCPKNESTEREDLLHDRKEMQEHRLVVEDLQEALARYGTLEISPTEILELPTLYHLHTAFQVSCPQTPPFVDLIQRLHPTPALGVAPRAAGYHWMQELPGQEGRHRFGGPFAILEPDRALCLVGIRNLQWNEKEAMIGSGCGVVAASELSREWRELFQKRMSVRKILGLE